MHSEYDALRERLSYLAKHRDLGNLEPEILQVAAQVSRVSEGLATTFSDAAISHAKAFLPAGQEEVEHIEEHIERAIGTTREIRQCHQRQSMDGDVVLSRLEGLKAELKDVLPEVGLTPANANPDSGVEQLHPKEEARATAAS